MFIAVKKLPLLLFVLTLFTINLSCTSGTQRSRIVIQFDKSLFSASQQTQLSPSTVQSLNTPQWGLSDPNVIADIDCFAIFVGAEESGMREDSCTTYSDNKINFGPRAGFYPISSNGEIFVTAGQNRKIYLAGMASQNGQCPSNFDTNSNLDFNKYSHPFVLGHTNANLTSGENIVQINLHSVFTDANKIQTCDFINNSSDELTLSHYPSKTSIWVSDNDIPRTVTFSHKGVRAECSKDAGSSYQSCNTDSTFVWQFADKTIEHRIRVFHSDGSTEEKSFVPNDIHGSISSIVCDKNFNTSGTVDDFNDDTGTTSFVSAIQTDNQTICMGKAQLTHGSTTTENMPIADGVTIISRQGLDSSIRFYVANKTVFLVDNKSNIKIIGMRIEGATSGMTSMKIQNSSNNILIQNSNLWNSGGVGFGLNVDNSGNTTAITVTKDSRLYASGNGSTGLKLHDSRIIVSDSEIGSQGNSTIIIDNSTATISNAEINAHGASTSNRTLNILEDGTVTLTNSSITDYNGAGIHLSGTSSEPATLSISNTSYRRKYTATSSDDEPVIVTAGSGHEVVNSASNGNFFCHEDAINAAIGSIISGSYTGNFDPTAQLNGANATPAVCP